MREQTNQIPHKEGSQMKRIVTLALMMLVGGYGAVHAQTTTTETEASTKEFLGLKWGLGIGVMGGFGGDTAVEKASLVGPDKIVQVDEEGTYRPQAFLEMHAFVIGNKVRCWHQYQQKMAGWRDTGQTPKSTNTEKGVCPELSLASAAQEPPMPDPPLMGFGPFVALQGDTNKVINAFTFGFMWGFRKDPKASSSVNIGVGLSFNPSVQVLGNGVKEGQKLPNGETAVRFKKEGRFGWVVMTSFTF
jgi:hypothetical protein